MYVTQKLQCVRRLLVFVQQLRVADYCYDSGLEGIFSMGQVYVQTSK